MDSVDMQNASSIQVVNKELLESYRREFDQLSASFRDLEGKAQGTITISGFALSAALAFQKILPDRGYAPLLILIAVVALLAAALCSVLALRVRQIRSAPSGEEVRELVKDLQRVEATELPLRTGFFFGDIARLWASCIEDKRSANEVKGKYLRSGQIFLLLALTAVAAVVITSIIMRALS